MRAARFHVRPGRLIAIQHPHKMVDQRVAAVVAADDGGALLPGYPTAQFRRLAPKIEQQRPLGTNNREVVGPIHRMTGPPNAPGRDGGDGTPGERQLNGGKVLDTPLRVRLEEM